MRDIDFYLDKAKENAGIKYDAGLASLLGISRSYITHFRKGIDTPAPALMLHIADVAGIDRDLALMDLNIWNSQGDVQKAYICLAKRIQHFMLILCVSLCAMFSMPAKASEASQSLNAAFYENIYYHFYIAYTCNLLFQDSYSRQNFKINAYAARVVLC